MKQSFGGVLEVHLLIDYLLESLNDFDTRDYFLCCLKQMVYVRLYNFLETEAYGGVFVM